MRSYSTVQQPRDGDAVAHWLVAYIHQKRPQDRILYVYESMMTGDTLYKCKRSCPLHHTKHTKVECVQIRIRNLKILVNFCFWNRCRYCKLNNLNSGLQSLLYHHRLLNKSSLNLEIFSFLSFCKNILWYSRNFIEMWWEYRKSV